MQNYRGATGLSGDWGVASLANDTILNRGTIIQNKRQRCTIAQINAGIELLPAVAGYKYRMVGCKATAYGGAVGATTTVDVTGTQSTAVKLVAFGQASLTQSAVLSDGGTGGTVLADGASYLANDAGTAISIGKTGSNLTTATGVDIIVSYVLEAA